ncbi:hypothetical protein LINPERHAP1_LOCUS30772 [Linum perenne]
MPLFCCCLEPLRPSGVLLDPRQSLFLALQRFVTSEEFDFWYWLLVFMESSQRMGLLGQVSVSC